MFYNPKYASPKTEPINLAFSCGVDSVFAAYFIKNHLKREVILCHYNHRLRDENNAMEIATYRFANFLGVSCRVGCRSKPIPESGSIEAFCRGIRYSWLQRNCDHVTVCHHLDDAIEQYLFNTLRGHPEHVPIAPVSAFGTLKIYRPFIGVNRKEIEDFVDKHDLRSYVYEDGTNSDQRYMRNWIRHSVIPTINQNYSGLHKVVKKKFYL